MKTRSDRTPALVAACIVAAFASSFVAGAKAQSTDQQLQQMEKQLDMNATPDVGALDFQDDLAKLEQCQSDCRPLIDRMLAKYKSGADFGANPKLGASDTAQLAAALASAAATLTKEAAASVQAAVAKSLGPAAEQAFAGAYQANVAPFDPK